MKATISRSSSHLVMAARANGLRFAVPWKKRRFPITMLHCVAEYDGSDAEVKTIWSWSNQHILRFCHTIHSIVEIRVASLLNVSIEWESDTIDTSESSALKSDQHFTNLNIFDSDEQFFLRTKSNMLSRVIIHLRLLTSSVQDSSCINQSFRQHCFQNTSGNWLVYQHHLARQKLEWRP